MQTRTEDGEMTNEERTQALKLLDVAPRYWQQLADDPGKLCVDPEWIKTAETLERAGIAALLLSEYITARRGGDHKNHKTAAEMVTKRHKALRRALGFSIPSAGLLVLR